MTAAARLRSWRGRPLAVAAAVFVLALAASAALLWKAESLRLRDLREQASHLAQTHAQLLQRNVASMTASNYALAAMVRQGNGSIDNFEAAASQLLLINPGLLALSVSPNGIIRSVVPREANAGLIGFNQLADPGQRVEAALTRDTGRLTLAGPLQLAQGGGIGLVSRLPIYLPYAGNNYRFWGFSNVTMRLDDLLRGVDLPNLQARGHHYVLWRSRAESGERQVIAASTDAMLDAPVRQSLEVPNGAWNLDVAPVRGWHDQRWLAAAMGSGLLASLLLAYLARLLVEQRLYKAGLEAEVAERTAQILATRNQLKSTLDALRDPLFELGLDGHIHGYSAPPGAFPESATRDVVGHNLADYLGPDSTQVVMGAIRQANLEGQARGAEFAIRIGKRTRWFDLSVARKADSDAGGNGPRFVAMARDVTAHRSARHEIRRLAFYDPLTDLPNRRLLQDRLEHARKATVRTGHLGALLLIDMDNFKALNDTMGHDKGDLLLQQVAQRLTACVRECDTVARLGGDEFVVMIDDVGSTGEEAVFHATAVAEKVVHLLGESYDIAGRTHRSSTSVGVSLFGADAATVDDILRRSDVAMYQAKAAGRNTLRFFDPAMQAMVEARAALEADMRQGLVAQEFLLHYQPQVQADGRVVGAEALARWQHPRRGSVSPAEFITVAEQSGLILDLGLWVLRSACRQLAAWAMQPGMAHLSLAVNVSVHQFRQAGFVDQVLAVLRETGASPRRLKLEITESMFAYDLEELIQKMTALKAAGVLFALDDFGTGYSSLSYLKRLPLDQLKIDQSFVRDVLTDANDAAIARTIVALARSLGLGVIAEGVETPGQRDFLHANGCAFFQGYLFSRPLPARDFDAFMAGTATEAVATGTAVHHPPPREDRSMATPYSAQRLLEHLDNGQLWPCAIGEAAGTDLAAAYQTQWAVRALRVARGEQPRGFKIGFTNRGIWPRYQVFAPIWGTVWDGTLQFCEGEATLALGRSCQPRIEPEVVFGMRATPPAGASLQQLFEAIEWIAPGFEIVQCHLPGWKFCAADTVADGALHARLLVGRRVALRAWVPDAGALEAALGAAEVQLLCDAQAVERGQGSNVLDNPLRALQHFLEGLRASPGAPELLPGDVVTTGTWTDAWPVAAGQCWRADFSAPLGSLQMRLR